MRVKALTTTLGILFALGQFMDKTGTVGSFVASGVVIGFNDVHKAGIALENTTNATIAKKTAKFVVVKAPVFVYKKVIK